MTKIIADEYLKKELSKEQKDMDKATQDNLKVPYEKQGSMDKKNQEKYIQNIKNDEEKRTRLENQSQKYAKTEGNSKCS